MFDEELANPLSASVLNNEDVGKISERSEVRDDTTKCDLVAFVKNAKTE